MSWGDEDKEIVDVSKKEVEKKEDKEPAFKKASEISEKKGLKVGVWGPTAGGKTHFSMTAPSPIHILDTELGSASVAHYFPNKDVNISEIFVVGTDELWERDDVDSFQKIKDAVDYIYNNQDQSGTLIIDSGTDLWNLCQSYCKVKIFKLRPEDRMKYQFDWGKINNVYLQLIAKLLAIRSNVIITGRNKELYGSTGNPTGNYEPGWMKSTQYMLDVVINIRPLKRDNKTVYLSEIVKCRQAGLLRGKTYENLTFDKLVEEINKYKEIQLKELGGKTDEI